MRHLPSIVLELASVISGVLRTQSLSSPCSQESRLMLCATKLLGEPGTPEAVSFLSLHSPALPPCRFPACLEVCDLPPSFLLREIPWFFLPTYFFHLCLKLITSLGNVIPRLSSLSDLPKITDSLLYTPTVAPSLPWPSRSTWTPGPR